MPLPAPRFFATAADFGRWLQQHAASEAALIVGYYKLGSGRPSMNWPDSVDEALCVGWIDGVRRRIDEQAYQIRFTPRRPGSIWSAVNIAKYAALTAQGRMLPAGAAAFAARRDERSMVYAYEQTEPATLSADEERLFRQQPTAWLYWQAAPPGYRKQALHHITTAKKPATRAARLARLIEASAAGLRQ